MQWRCACAYQIVYLPPHANNGKVVQRPIAVQCLQVCNAQTRERGLTQLCKRTAGQLLARFRAAKILVHRASDSMLVCKVLPAALAGVLVMLITERLVLITSVPAPFMLVAFVTSLMTLEKKVARCLIEGFSLIFCKHRL